MADILVIDDEPQMRRLISRILRKAGHTVREAADGCIGLQMCRERRPALVITDIVMPVGEGIETIQALRQSGEALPILAISGNSPALYLRAATGLGATAALAKPFRADDLLAVVANLLNDAADCDA